MGRSDKMTRVNLVRGQRRMQLRYLLVRVSKQTGILPQALFLKGVECENKEAIGGGGFADIFRATLNGKDVALKRLRSLQIAKRSLRSDSNGRIVGDSCPAEVKAFCREAITWRQLKHPHILSFMGVDCSTFSPNVCMVSPWMSNGTIISCIREFDEKGLEVPLRRWVSFRYLFLLDRLNRLL